MDPSSPGYFCQLRLILQIHLDAIYNGAGRALYCIATIAFYNKCRELLAWPRGPLELLRLLAVSFFFVRRLRNTALFIRFSFVLPPKRNQDFEIQFERPIPSRMRNLLVALRVVALFVTMWQMRNSSDVFWAPLLALSTKPSCLLWLQYINALRIVASFLALWHMRKSLDVSWAPQLALLTDPSCLLWLSYINQLQYSIAMCTDDLSIGSLDFNVTEQVIRLIVYPYEAWTRRKRRRLAQTFITGPTQGTKPALSVPIFQYEPITEPGIFRLLKLEPVSNRMSVTLEHHSINTCPPYWAVSYCWGQPVLFDHALLVGISDIRITASCAQVLELLTPLRTRYLWIDAVCIDQSDLTDKVFQFPLMAQIYSNAQQVVGCLGTNAALPSVFPSLLNQSFFFKLIQYLVFDFDGLTHNPRMHYMHRLHDWQAFNVLLAHPYWDRAWIVQELVHANKLIFVYGETAFSWKQVCYIANGLYARTMTFTVPNMEEILRFLPMLRFHLVRQSDRLDMLTDMKRRVQSMNRADWPPFAQVVDRLYKVESSDRRDQIFALLSLASDGNAAELKPTYDEAVTYEHVITKAIRYSLENGQLNLFLAAGLAYRYEDDYENDPRPILPSWVPVFPQTSRPRTTNPDAEKARKSICQIKYSVSDDGKELSLYGIPVDHVAVISPVSLATLPGELIKAFVKGPSNEDVDKDQLVNFSNNFFTSHMEKLPSFLREARQLALRHSPKLFAFAEFSYPDTYWSAMAMDWDSIGGGGTLPASSATRSLFIDVETGLTLGKEKSLDRVLEKLDDGFFEKTPFNHWSNYDFAITTGGRLAWVPPGTKNGDALCFFEGADVPFILRPVESGRFEFVGEGYIQELMRGKVKELDEEKRWFRII
jgi:hypothetical protein